MTKKLVSLFLALVMLLSVCATVSAESEYAEHFEISIGTAMTMADDAWKDNWHNKFIQEKFNITLVPYTSAAGFDEVTNLWIATGDMPDWITAGIDLEGLLDMADQGMLAALPDGWQERYPNLWKEVASTNLESYCTIDGKWYILPRSIFSPNFPLEFVESGKAMDHSTNYFRTDWAEAIGVTIPPMISVAELKPILKQIAELKSTEDHKVYPLTGPGNLDNIFIRSEVPYFDSMYMVDGEYVLGAADPGVIEGIKNYKEFYEEGLITPDFFNYKQADVRNLFTVGDVFMIADTGAPAHAKQVGDPLLKENPEMGDAPAMNNVNILSESGEYLFTRAGLFWRTLLFSPELENQPEKFERILAIADWLATLDGVMHLRLGEPGVDWDYDENGKPYVIRTYEHAEANGAQLLYHMCPSSQDAIGYGYNPSVPDWAVEMGLERNMNTKSKMASDKVPAYIEDGLLAFQRWPSENKIAYKGIDWSSEITRIVITPGLDVETEWNNFIKANEGLWKPLLDELNATIQ